MSGEDLELRKAHAVFANEVVEELLINLELRKLEGQRLVYCDQYILEAIFFIRSIFREDFKEIISYVRTGLKNDELFKAYGELIPVNKDNCYFYHYLKRISLILEMTEFCYKICNEDYSRYFEMARSCIEKCPDVQYFESAGGWIGLKCTAMLLTKIALPHIILRYFENNANVPGFASCVQKIRLKCASLKRNILSRKVAECLEILKEILEEKIPEDTSNKNRRRAQFYNAGMQEALESGKSVLSIYINDCFPEEVRPKPSPKEAKDLIDKSASEMEVGHISGKCSQRKSVNDNIPLKSAKTKDDAFVDCAGGYSSEKPSTSCTALCSPDKATAEESQALYSSFSDLRIAPGKSKTAVVDGENSRSIPSEISKSRPLQNLEDIPEERENDIKPSFIVPKAYVAYLRRENLYVAKMDPPSKRKNLDESLKSILDANIHNKNYKELANGDIFVCSPDSTDEKEILILFLDSSSDQEIEEDAYKLICLFKKKDMEYEGKSCIRQSRKYKGTISTAKKTEREDCKSFSVESSESTIMKASSCPYYMEYIVCLYKRCLPAILKEKLKIILKEKLIKRPTKSEPSNTVNVKEQSDVNFILTASLLKNRKAQLIDSLQKNMMCLVLFTRETRMLTSAEENQLDSYIRRGLFHPINFDKSVYLVSLNCFYKADFSKMKCLALFPAVTAKIFSNDPNRKELIRILDSYANAIRPLVVFTIPDASYFDHVRRDIDDLISTPLYEDDNFTKELKEILKLF